MASIIKSGKFTVAKKDGIAVPGPKSVTFEGVEIEGLSSATVEFLPSQPARLVLVIEDFDFKTEE